jgi:c-di-GMP-binding flagellar brake protein YcgR
MKKKQRTEKDSIDLWERLILVIEKGGSRSEFLTRLEDIKQDSYIFEMPIRQSGSASLSKGDIVEVSYNKKDAAYTFKASIKDLFEGESSSIEVEKLTDASRIQRRRFVRLDISGDINLRILESPDSNEGSVSQKFRGSLLNISAGGVLFETETKIDAGSLLILDFTIKGHYPLNNILAVVKRAEAIDDNIYIVGSEFISNENRARYGLETLGDFLPPGTGTFDDNLQKLMVQFIYKQQVELRKKGILHQ